jgi:hypothetical protein
MLSLISHWRGVAQLGRRSAVLLTARAQIHSKIRKFVLDVVSMHSERHGKFNPHHNRTVAQSH